MNTRHCGLSAVWRSRQAARAAATSGRSCSAACWVFFSRQAMGQEEAAERRAAGLDTTAGQADAELFDGQIRLGRQQRPHPLGMDIERRAFPSAVSVRRDRATPAPALHQLDHEADADLELGGGGAPRPPALDRAHNALAQIHRIRSCHPSLASSTQRSV
jgi:hypothetical protein